MVVLLAAGAAGAATGACDADAAAADDEAIDVAAAACLALLGCGVHSAGPPPSHPPPNPAVASALGPQRCCPQMPLGQCQSQGVSL